MNLEVALRPVDEADKPFLLDLFKAVRSARFNFQPGGHPQMEASIRLQFQAAEHALSVRHEGSADHSLIIAAGSPAGRLLVTRSETALHLADISLMPARQRQGIGAFVVRGILDQAHAVRQPVRCRIQQDNPAAYGFLRSLGFRVTAQDSAYAHLEYSA